MSRIQARAAMLAFAFLTLATAAFAHDYRVGDLHIDHPWTRATAPGARVGAAYMRIANGGAGPDRLIAARSPAAGRVEIHEMRMEGDIMRMRELEGGLDLPAGATVELNPGGYHIMLIDLARPLARGAKVPMTLTFARAGVVTVELAVEAAGARDAGHDHHHGHAPTRRH
jgi:hypothetical protein